SNTSGSSLFLLWFLGTEGPEHRSVPLVKLGKRLNVIQPDGLNARGNAAEEEDEDLSEEQEDEPNDRYQHVVLNDEAVKNQRIERSPMVAFATPIPASLRYERRFARSPPISRGATGDSTRPRNAP